MDKPLQYRFPKKVGRPYSFIFTGTVNKEPEYLDLDTGQGVLFVGDLPVHRLAQTGERVMIIVVRVHEEESGAEVVTKP